MPGLEKPSVNKNVLLEVKGLDVSLTGHNRDYPVLEELDFKVRQGESLGIVGESGCGKSITALAIMGLLPASMIASGEIILHRPTGCPLDLMTLDEPGLCGIRGKSIGMIFQEPMTALNPVQTIGHQVAESLMVHEHASMHECSRQASRMLDRVGLPASMFPRNLYPHQLSGGQRQRVVIAIAMVCRPSLLIADEPSTALDVTIQAQILELLAELVKEENMALMLITHDLGVVAENTDRMLVMYAGRMVESGPTDEVFSRLKHPYTRGLMAAMPAADEEGAGDSTRRLQTIPGRVPALGNRPGGCVFKDRCGYALEKCAEKVPPLVKTGPDHQCACWATGG